MIATGIYPHRLCSARALKAHARIKLNGVSISNKNVLMEASISLHRRDHDRPAYSFSPAFGMDNQMRIIDDQKTV
jgi:hypothetical protein